MNGLNVEPGAYDSCVARLSSGRSRVVAVDHRGVLLRQTLHEPRGVERRPRRHRLDPAGGRIHHDDRAGVRLEVAGRILRIVEDAPRVLDPVGERLLGDPLRVDVEREHQVVAGDRGLLAEQAHDLLVRVDEVLLPALVTLEEPLVLLLQARLADEVVRPVVLEPFRVGDVVRGDLSHPAQDVRGHVPVRVVADGGRHDLDAGELVLVFGEVEADVLVHVVRDRLRLIVVVVRAVEPFADLLHGDPDDVGQTQQLALGVVVELILRDPDLERDAVQDQGAMAVVEDAAAGRVRLHEPRRLPADLGRRPMPTRAPAGTTDAWSARRTSAPRGSPRPSGERSISPSRTAPPVGVGIVRRYDEGSDRPGASARRCRARRGTRRATSTTGDRRSDPAGTTRSRRR